MLTEPAMTEFFSFLSAVLLAATVSATARGLSGNDEKTLEVFKKFYVDLAGAFAGLTLLSAGGPTSWATLPLLASITALDGAVSLLPLAVGVLLIALLIARHRWGPRTKWADLLVTFLVAAVILVAVRGLTSGSSAAQGFDRAAQRVASSYCSGHSSDVAKILQLIAPELNHRETGQEGPSEKDANPGAEEERQPAEAPVRSRQDNSGLSVGPAFVTTGISERTRKKVRVEFCDAVVIYRALREAPITGESESY